VKLAIVGSRNYPHLDEVRHLVRILPTGTEVVSGGAVGVDTAAVEEAKIRGLPTQVFLPTGGYYARNRQIVAYCDKLIAFMAGVTPGTQNAIGLAARAGKLLAIREYKE